jgi:hypothetical protein
LKRRTGDHAKRSVTTKPASSHPGTDTAVDLFDNWIDPIEIAVRERVRGFIEELIREELDEISNLLAAACALKSDSGLRGQTLLLLVWLARCDGPAHQQRSLFNVRTSTCSKDCLPFAEPSLASPD